MARTIRIEVTMPTIGVGDSHVVVSTEAIVDTVEDARQEGCDAADVVNAFCEGYAERQQESS